MAVTAFDIHNPETVVHDLEEATTRLRTSETVPDSVLGLLTDLCDDVGNADVGEAQDVSPAAWIAIQAAALKALAAVRESDEREQRRKLRLLIEELRFRLARLAEDQPISDGRPIEEVVRWLDQAWNVTQGVKGELFGVSERTWQRWASPSESSRPTGDEDRQVRLVARLVNDLRFLLTANGVLDWLTAELPDPGGPDAARDRARRRDGGSAAAGGGRPASARRSRRLSFEAVAYRAAGHETPLWAFPNTSDGRYNRAGRLPTQYLSLHPMTPWAELLRNLDHRTADKARAMRVEIWAVRIALADDPADITFDSAKSYGIDPEGLVSDDYDECRSLAERLHADGVHSLITPSAALPGTSNLVVIEPAVVTDHHFEPIDPEDWPTALLAQNGRCPEDLWDRVHYNAASAVHPGLAAWRDGEELMFTQPGVTAATLTAA